MEDIYGDLDNYEEEKNVQELKNENKELKSKLEEYASTLQNLQKEFDKLSVEYKKLELNYSSLLKTAKAEIERKTTIITNLNLEKDQLVLNALQKRGRLPPLHHNKNYEKENTPETEKQQLKQDSDKQKNVPNIQRPTEKCQYMRKDGECENNHDKKSLQSVINYQAGKGFQEEKEFISKGIEDNIRDRDKNKIEAKESKKGKEKAKPTQEKHYQCTENVKDKVSRIRKRRKSMPLLKHADFKFSSDEEQEDNTDNLREHRYRRKSPSRDLNDRRNDKDRNGRYEAKEPQYRPTEAHRFDEKHSSHCDSLRDNYFRSRYNEGDKHRSRDTRARNETRFNKRFSPNRSRYNNREYSNDQQHKSESGRQRVTVSSPPEKKRRRSRELDRHRLQNEETLSFKQRMHDPFEGPAHKRLRTESPQGRSEEHVYLQDRIEYKEAPAPQPLPYSSLQSPDYCGINAHPTSSIIEIKGTANTKLEDPRLKSNKYILDTHENKIILSTVVGRNVDIKCVDKTAWKMDEKIQMPTPLKHRPEITEDYIHEVYMDMHNPISNISLESGEVQCSEDDLLLPTIGKADSTNTGIKYSKQDVIEIPGLDDAKLNKIQATEPRYDLLKKWKIPKNDKTNTNKTADITTEKLRNELNIQNLGKLSRNETINKEEKGELERVMQLSLDTVCDNTYKRHEKDNISKQCLNINKQKEEKDCEKTTQLSLEDETAASQKEHKKDNLSKLCYVLKTQYEKRDIDKDMQLPLSDVVIETDPKEHGKDDIKKLYQIKNSNEEKKDTKYISQWSLLDESLNNKEKEDDKHNFSTLCQEKSTNGANSDFAYTNETHKEDKEKNHKEKERDADKMAHCSVEDIHTNNIQKEDKHVHFRKRNQEKRSREEKRDLIKSTQTEYDLHCQTKVSSTNKRISKNKRKNTISDVENLSEKVMSARDTVEGDLELSDETSDCAESVDPSRYVKEKNALSGDCIKEPIIVRIATEKLREGQNSNNAGEGEPSKLESKKIYEKKNQYAEVFKESFIKPREEETADKDKQNVKDDNNMKAKLCYLFGDSSSLITPDDLGIVDPPVVENIVSKYSPMFDNTQDALDLNVADMEKVQTRSSNTKFDENAQSMSQDVKSEKKHKSKNHKSSKERKRKAKQNSESSSGTEQNIENIKEVFNKKPDTVKTVIISSGVQNKMDPVSDEVLLSSVKSNKDLPSTQSLPNLMALATSTPHKISAPLSSAPEASYSKSDTIQSNDASNGKSTSDSKLCQNNLDVPDVRIVVKRRRKGKAPN